MRLGGPFDRMGLERLAADMVPDAGCGLRVLACEDCTVVVAAVVTGESGSFYTLGLRFQFPEDQRPEPEW